MKVVLFCGGYGMRIRDYSPSTPKPMVNIGVQPILVHLMKYYAFFGHMDFILCLGWRKEAIGNYFYAAEKYVSRKEEHPLGGRTIHLSNGGSNEWRVTFVDTGEATNIGQRLKAVQPYVEGEKEFLCNYTDGLTDLHLPDLIEYHRRKQVVATFLSVRPKHNSFHTVSSEGDGLVSDIESIHKLDVWMNGGFFLFTPAIFDFIKPGDELVEKPFKRLIKKQQLSTFKYEGFWSCMDTFKEKEMLDRMCMERTAPWEVWNRMRRVERRNMHQRKNNGLLIGKYPEPAINGRHL